MPEALGLAEMKGSSSPCQQCFLHQTGPNLEDAGKKVDTMARPQWSCQDQYHVNFGLLAATLDDGELAEDDGQSSLDDFSTVASTTLARKKTTRRAGKRAKGRPCHKRGFDAATSVADFGTAGAEAGVCSLQQPTFEAIADSAAQETAVPRRSFYPPVAKNKERQGGRVRSEVSASQPLANASTGRRDGDFKEVATISSATVKRSSAPLATVQSLSDDLGDDESTGAPRPVVPDAADVPELSAIVGKRVLLTGLVKITAFNGEWGKILSFDAESQRYVVEVRLASGAPVRAKLRRENLIVPATVALKFVDEFDGDHCQSDSSACASARTAEDQTQRLADRHLSLSLSDTASAATGNTRSCAADVTIDTCVIPALAKKRASTGAPAGLEATLTARLGAKVAADAKMTKITGKPPCPRSAATVRNAASIPGSSNVLSNSESVAGAAAVLPATNSHRSVWPAADPVQSWRPSLRPCL